MKAVILAGGYGTRISEESHLRPKPMVEIGDKPILWHIMKIYNFYKINEFIICGGYKCNVIEQYFKENSFDELDINIIDTGLDTMTGGRLKRIESYVNDTFCLTYGDGVSDVNLEKLIEFHKKKSSVGTLTAIHPPERYGVLDLSEDYVTEFHEKHRGESSWINGGFFVFEPSIFDYLDDDTTILERTPLETLAKERKLAAFRHNGFWQSMDTLRERNLLNELWKKQNAPWKIW